MRLDGSRRARPRCRRPPGSSLCRCRRGPARSLRRSRARARAAARPRGVARLNRSNACGRNSGGRPAPPSVTRRRDRSVSATAPRVERRPPPWRRALSTRLPSACSRRTQVAGATIPAAESDDLQRTARARARARRTGRRQRRGARDLVRLDRRSGSRPSSARASTSRSSASRTSRSTSSAAERSAASSSSLRPRAPQGQLELGPEQRERRAELVAGVGHEAALPRETRLESGEHLVQRHSEPADLVAALGQRQPAARDARVETSAALPAHRLDRTQRRAREEVAGERREQERERPDDEELRRAVRRAPRRGPRARPRRRGPRACLRSASMAPSSAGGPDLDPPAPPRCPGRSASSSARLARRR